jgi:aromatic-L-amino-acid decarboxylase
MITTFNLLETIALRWLRELLGIDQQSQGLFVSGGAVANLVALGAARQHVFEQLGVDPARDGMPDMHRWRLYASSEKRETAPGPSHPSIKGNSRVDEGLQSRCD